MFSPTVPCYNPDFFFSPPLPPWLSLPVPAPRQRARMCIRWGLPRPVPHITQGTLRASLWHPGIAAAWRSFLPSPCLPFQDHSLKTTQERGGSDVLQLLHPLPTFPSSIIPLKTTQEWGGSDVLPVLLGNPGVHALKISFGVSARGGCRAAGGLWVFNLYLAAENEPRTTPGPLQVGHREGFLHGKDFQASVGVAWGVLEFPSQGKPGFGLG